MPELPNIVRERLKVSRPTAEHPDADVLTAFAERALPKSERAVVAEHLARCHDCRDILALALPATVTVETARVPLPVRGSWLRAPVLRWGVVAAGVAVFAVTGLLQFQRRHVTQTFIAAREANAPIPEALTTQASRAKESAPGAPNALAGSADGSRANASRVNGGSTIADNADAAFKKERVAAAPMNEKAAPSTSLALSGRKLAAALPFHGPASGRASSDSSLGGLMKQSVRLYGGMAPSSTGAAEPSSQLVAGNVGDQARSQPFPYQGKDQKKEQGQGAGAGGRAFMDVTVDKAKPPETTAVEVSAEAPVLETSSAASASSPTSGASWGISASGSLLRSFDQGRTWASVDVNASFPVASQMAMVVPQSQKYQQATQDTSQLRAPAATQSQNQTTTVSKSQALGQQLAAASAVSIPVFRAISAAGLEVWAGGSAGVLYHSADGGQQWTRVVLSASGIPLTGDIVGIAFNDSQHGQITTSTHELWTTSDAGQTWQKQ
jgi:hypothetical protein